MPAVFGLECDHAIARGHVRLRERAVGERVVARRGAERMAGHGIGTAERDAPLQRQRITAHPATTDEPNVDPASGADAGVMANVEEDAIEAIGSGRDRVTEPRGDSGVGDDVGAAGILEGPPNQPPRGGFFRIVASVEDRAQGDRREVPFVDRRVRTPERGIAEHRPGILVGDARLPLATHFERQFDLSLRLREGARAPPFVQVVVAVVSSKEERAPADFRVVQSPVFDRRHNVERAQSQTDGPHVARAQLAAEHVAEIAALVRQIAGGPEHP